MNSKIRSFFPWIAAHKKFIYFDNASTSLKPYCVIEAINDYLINYSVNTHDSNSLIGQQTTNYINEVRHKIAKFINATSDDEIIFTSGATFSLNAVVNLLKNNLSKNDEIILSEADHASLLLPWIKLSNEIGFKICWVKIKKQTISEEDFLKKLTINTKIVNITSVSNTLGYLLNTSKLINDIKLFNQNIIVIVDAAQQISSHKIDVKKMQCDFLMASGHKFFAGTGIGFLYIKKELTLTLAPFLLGGAMNDTINKDKYITLSSPEKFEAGTLNIEGIYSMGAAIDFINEIGYKIITAHNLELKKYAIKKMKNIKNITIYNPKGKIGIIIFNINNINANDIALYLSNHGIISRAGLSCAKLVAEPLNTSQFVRISFSLYNTKKEIDYMVKILNNFKKEDIFNGIV